MYMALQAVCLQTGGGLLCSVHAGLLGNPHINTQEYI